MQDLTLFHGHFSMDVLMARPREIILENSWIAIGL
jgi:hypothetical protein